MLTFFKISIDRQTVPLVPWHLTTHSLSGTLSRLGLWLTLAKVKRWGIWCHSHGENNKRYGRRRKLRAADYDPTMQVGTDLASHLSALPMVSFLLLQGGETFTTASNLQAASMMDASHLTSLEEMWEFNMTSPVWRSPVLACSNVKFNEQILRHQIIINIKTDFISEHDFDWQRIHVYDTIVFTMQGPTIVFCSIFSKLY